jgi:Holliday junction resolvase RusA-like endonuclease
MTTTFQLFGRPLPPSLNKRIHYREKKRLRDGYTWEFISQRNRFHWPASPVAKCVMVITRFGVRQLDRDNLYGSMKLPIDGLRAAGIIEDDTEEHIDLTVKQERVSSWKDQRVEIAITEVKETE